MDLLINGQCDNYESPRHHQKVASANLLLPTALSMTAGAVDVIGFLALGGLFTAHITGNLAVLAAHYITGGFGQIGPLLAVPIFIVVLGAVTLTFIGKVPPRARRALLVLQAVLLAAFFGFGVVFGPFANPDSAMAVFVGMLGVAAMATQNALVRLALPGEPSTAVMTTNTTQLTIDVAMLARGHGESDELVRARHRASLTSFSVIGFIVGVGLGAILEIHLGLWALILPLILAAFSILLGELWTPPGSAQTVVPSESAGRRHV
jgi:uncharacterized membrane protein YoaK (UPF0700 family)